MDLQLQQPGRSLEAGCGRDGELICTRANLQMPLLVTRTASTPARVCCQEPCRTVFYASAGRTYGRSWVCVSHWIVTCVRAALLSCQVAIRCAPTYALYDTVFGGVQVTRAFSTHFSGYVSYGAQSQSTNYSLYGQNAFNGASSTFGIGGYLHTAFNPFGTIFKELPCLAIVH